MATLTLGVCVIDNERSNVADAFASERSAKLAARASSRFRYLDGRDLAKRFLWLLSNQLDPAGLLQLRLLGKDPPSFEIRHWNADTTRMPAALHREIIDDRDAQRPQ